MNAPSCVSVFQDEMTEFLPDDQDARRLRGQVFLLGEFLQGLPGYRPPTLHRHAIAHGHCHQKSVLGMNPETTLLKRMGLDLEMPDTGCCGMAGAFGFEKGKYDVSIKVGERVLLPVVRAASPDTLLVADGFSCREQIAQTTNRQAVHLAQVASPRARRGTRRHRRRARGGSSTPRRGTATSRAGCRGRCVRHGGAGRWRRGVDGQSKEGSMKATTLSEHEPKSFVLGRRRRR